MPRSTSVEIGVPAGYPELLAELNTRIWSAQVRGAFAVTHELVLLYWSIGRDLSSRFGREGWGAKIVDRPTREWYIRASLEHGWSQNLLVHVIAGRLHEREGTALTNFRRTLPPEGSDMAAQILRDPYNFDFLKLAHQHGHGTEESWDTVSSNEMQGTPVLWL